MRVRCYCCQLLKLVCIFTSKINVLTDLGQIVEAIIHTWPRELNELRQTEGNLHCISGSGFLSSRTQDSYLLKSRKALLSTLCILNLNLLHCLSWILSLLCIIWLWFDIKFLQLIKTNTTQETLEDTEAMTISTPNYLHQWISCVPASVS